MAWLHSSPKRNDKDTNPKTRLSTIGENHPAMNLPDSSEFLTKCFELLGFNTSGSMGSTALTWCEVKAFTDSSGYHLNGWEAEQMIMMSRSFCYMSSLATKMDCPPPYQKGFDSAEALQQMRDRVNKQADSFN